jgi:hypothetical protein
MCRRLVILYFLWCFLAAAFSEAAQNTDPFPTVPSKKGLQVQMIDDALALGVRHATLNVDLDCLAGARSEGR